MTKYRFHDDNILELDHDGKRVFIDLSEIGNVEFNEDKGTTEMRVYVDVEDVRNLFANYGMLDKCPVEEMKGGEQKMDEYISLEDFMAYEDVRRSGVTNMFDVRRVQELSGLDRDTIIAIMSNYDKLSGQYLQK